MRAGALKYRLECYKPIRERDRYGAEKTVYEKTATIYAERVRVSGRRSEEVGEHFADYTVEYNVRDTHAVDEHWRIQQLGEHLYEVAAVIPNRDRGYKTLRCSRVNP